MRTRNLLGCITTVVMFYECKMHQEEINILNYLKKRDEEFKSLQEFVYVFSGKMELKTERILFYKRDEVKKICYSIEYKKDSKELILYYPYESDRCTRYNHDRGIFKKYNMYEIALVFDKIKEFEREGIHE